MVSSVLLYIEADSKGGSENSPVDHRGPRKSEWLLWGEESQGSEVTLWRIARAEQSALCDDEGRGRVP